MKKITGIIIDEIGNYPDQWREVKPLTLEKNIIGFREDEITQITKWCEETGCGRRTAYNQFRFKNRKQLNWFLLRWNSE